jgi:predicted transcriptional regulator
LENRDNPLLFYIVDWFLEKGESIKLEKKEFFEIPENLLKIRLNYLKKKGFVIFDKKTKAYKSAPTKKERFITDANPIRYCQKNCTLDVVTIISHFYKEKPRKEDIFNKPDLSKEINVIWEN